MRIQIFCFSLLFMASIGYAAAIPIKKPTPQNNTELANLSDYDLKEVAANFSDTQLAQFGEVSRRFHDIAQTVFETRPSYLWAKGQITKTSFHAHAGAILAVFVTNDGKIVSAGIDHRIYVWQRDGKTYKTIKEMTDDVDSEIRGAKFSRASNRVMLEHERIVNVWDVQTGKKINRFDTGNSFARWLSPDGTTIATKNIDSNDIEFWDIEKGEKIKQIPSRKIGGHYGVQDLVFSTDGKKIALYSDADYPVSVWNVETLEKEKQVEFVPPNTFVPVRLLFLPDKLLIAYKQTSKKSKEKRYAIWEVENNKLIAELVLKDPEINFDLRLIFTDDGNLAALPINLLTLSIWDIRLNKIIKSLKIENPCTTLQFSSDDKMLVAGCENGDIITWKVNPPEKKK